MHKIIYLIFALFLTINSYSAIIYVNSNAIGANNGTSWANAYTDLQSALSIAFINDDIWVAAGTYKPTQTTTRSISFVMKNGVDLFGGFNGTETNISERDFQANPTYLSGDIGAQGDNTDNTTKIVKIQNFTTPFTFDGFRIVSGYDSGSSGKGAGMYVTNNPGIMITINNTILYNNYAYYEGGGMVIDNSKTTFNNCEFLYNSSYNYGGGAIYSANSSDSYIYLNDCKFIGNNSRQGAVINFDGEELVMERNFVSSNTSTSSGNIINVSSGSTRFEINNSLIVGNQVSNGGDAIVMSYTGDANSSSMTNVTLCHNKNNSAFDVYAEAISQSNSAMVISNCIVYGNTNSDQNVQINAGNIVRNSIVENGYSTGINVNSTNPLFVNPGTLAIAPFDGSFFNYSLQDGSPAVNYGNNIYAQDYTFDFQNNARIQQLIVDCGAIESPFTDTQNPVANCSDVTIPLNTSGIALVDVVQIDNNSTDNLGITDYALSQSSFDCSEIGINSVILTVSDAAGNSSTCTSTVTVEDLLNPTILTQNISIQLNQTGQATISANNIDNGTSDNCELDTIYISQTEFSCANSGTNAITLTAVDIHGNTHTANATVTVVDTVFPVAIGQDIELYLNVNGTASISTAQINNGSYDDCSISSMTLSKTNFSCANIGANPVTFGVKDPFGNLSTTSVTVTVIDTIKPITIGHSVSVNLNLANPAVITASQINTTSSDNCTFNQTVAPSSFTTVGVYNVTLTSTDPSGNSSSNDYTVTVIEEDISGLTENNGIEFVLFPNPSEGMIHVKTNVQENQFEVRLLDISGKLLTTKRYFNTNEFDFMLVGAPGFYLLEIETPTLRSKQIKVIKL